MIRDLCNDMEHRYEWHEHYEIANLKMIELAWHRDIIYNIIV